MTERHGLSPSSIESIAGFTAGTVSTLVVHPLDIIKTRLQINTYTLTQTHSNPRLSLTSLPSLRILHTLLTSEGPSPLRSLYRGLTPNLLGNSLGWSLYFLWYSQAQNLLRHARSYPPSTPLTSLDYLTASLASGLFSAALTNPIWVIKTRMLSTSAAHRGAYPSMLFGLRAIAREEGWRGYWRGLIPTLAGVSHSAVYFVAYEKLKEYRAEQLQLQPPSLHASKPKLSNTDYLLLSAISKILAGTLTYPHQVIRARMQTYNNNYNLLASPTPKKVPSTPVGLFSTIHTLYHSDGLRGFYRGLGPNLLRVVPSTCVTFLVYENVRAGLTALEEEM